jgi:ABC-type dipeptide/oligopeptide/nickel transport system permease component
MARLTTRISRLGLRVLYLAALVWTMHLTLFLLFRVLPGGIGAMFGWGSLDPAFRVTMEKSLGLDGNWFDQYRAHVLAALRLDLGRTLRGQFSVRDVLADGLKASLPGFAAVLVGGLLGPVVALKTHLRPSAARPPQADVWAAGAVNLPPFIISAAAFAAYQAANRVGGGPAFYWPSVLMACALFPFLATFGAAAKAAGNVSVAPFVLTLRAMGLTPAELRRTLRPILFSAVRAVVARITVSSLLSTAFVEWLFGIPGFGYLGLRALQDADFALMFGWVFTAAIVVLVVSEVER